MMKKFLTAAVVAAGFTGTIRNVEAAPVAGTSTTVADTRVDTLMDEGFDFMKAKNYDSAAKKFRAVLKIEPKNVEANYQLCWIYNEFEEFELATKYANIVIRVSPRDSDAYRERGYAQLKTGQFEEAIESLEQAIELNPKDVNAHDYIVAAHKALGNSSEAAAWKRKWDKLKQANKPTPSDDDEDDVPVKPKKSVKPVTPDDDEDDVPVKPKKSVKPVTPDDDEDDVPVKPKKSVKPSKPVTPDEDEDDVPLKPLKPLKG